MDQGSMFVIIGALIFQCLLLYVIISAAVKSQARYKIDYAQMVLLAEMARKQGVDEKYIDEVLKNSK